MMNYLCDMMTRIMFWLIWGAFDNNHIPDATISPEKESVPSATHHASSATSKPNEISEENGELSNQRDKCVQREENSLTEDSRSKESQRNEMDNKEGNFNSNTMKNNQKEESEYATSDNSSNENGDIGAFENMREGSYEAYFAECDEMVKSNNATFSTDDGESIQGYDSVLESPPLPQPESEHLGFEISSFADLQDLEPISGLDLSIPVGMRGLCAYCLRWEDHPDDKFAEEDKVSCIRFMFCKTANFRRRKPLWAQCSACGFGMPQKGLRGRRFQRAKKFFRKVARME